MNYCPNCGTELRAGAKFCPACGCDLEQETRNHETTDTSQFQTDDSFELELEPTAGLNITRAEIKKVAQEKLSGRYGEWFKTIFLWLIAQWVVNLIFRIAFIKYISQGTSYWFASIFGPAYSSYDYYNYGYSYSPFAHFFWFLIMLLAIVAMFLIASLATATFQWCAIHTLRGNQADGLKIFAYFIKAQKNRVLKVNVLIAIYTFFWTLLLVIPGIVKSASYAMANYLLEKDSTLSASDAILLSRQIMHGYKLEFLILRASFFFWTILAIFQVTNFYVFPYRNVTEIQFLDTLYEHYIKQNQQ